MKKTQSICIILQLKDPWIFKLDSHLLLLVFIVSSCHALFGFYETWSSLSSLSGMMKDIRAKWQVFCVFFGGINFFAEKHTACSFTSRCTVLLNAFYHCQMFMFPRTLVQLKHEIIKKKLKGSSSSLSFSRWNVLMQTIMKFKIWRYRTALTKRLQLVISINTDRR